MTAPYPGPVAYAPVRRTNGLAIAALVLGICGFGILPVIFGHIALGQVRRTGDGGGGLAVAGLVLGYLALAGGLIALVIVGLAVGIPLWATGAAGGFR
jgi:hypothetical protein